MVSLKLNPQEYEEVKVEGLVQEELDIFSRKILESAKLSSKEQEKVLKNKETFQKFLNNILVKANKNIFEKNEILELILNYRPDILENNFKIKKILENKLIKDFDKNKNLAFLVLKNYIKSGEKLEKINLFINNISLDNELTKNILEEKFSQLLEQYGKITRRNTQKYFYNIKNKEIIKLILESKIVNEKGEINQKIIKNFNKQLNNNLEKDKLENRENLFTFLLNKLNISPELVDEKLRLFLNNIIDLFKIESDIEKIEKNEKKENLNNPSQSSLEKGRGNIEKNYENNFSQNNNLLDLIFLVKNEFLKIRFYKFLI